MTELPFCNFLFVSFVGKIEVSIKDKGEDKMANRIMLNETSYHGAGAIKEIANEAKARAFKKAFVCSDPDLIKFGVTSKVTDV